MAEMNVADSMEQYLLKDSDVPSDVLKQYNVEPVVETKQPKMMEAPDTQQVLNDTQQLGNTRQQTDELMNTMQQADTAVGFEYAPDPQFMEKVKNSKAYRLYFNTKPEQLEYAKNLASRIQQPLEKVLASEESLKVAEEMDARRRKIAALLPPDERQFAMDEVNKEYQLRPEYKAVEGLPDSVDRAIALHHYENVRVLKGIVDSFCAGVNNQTKAGSVIRDIEYRDYMGETITEEQEKQYNDAKRQQRELTKYVPDFFDNPLAAIAYGTGDQGTMMGRQTAKTQVYAIPLAGIVGAGTTALAGPVAGAAAAKSTWATATKWGTGLEMFKETVGGYYRDYKQYRKEDGSQLLSNEEARFAATLAAAGEAYIEVGNFDKIIDMLGNGAVKTATKDEAQQVLANIVANSADKASFKAQLSYYMKNRFGKAIAAGWSEMIEEGKQSIYTDTVHNAAALYTNYKDRKGDLNVISAGDILKNAAEETFAAGPSIIGMVGTGHVISSRPWVRRIADALKVEDETLQSAKQNISGQQMIEQILQDKANSDLAKADAEVYNQLVTNSLEGTVYENVTVDTDLLLGKEGNDEVFYQLATAAGKEKVEADLLKEQKASLTVPMSEYLKVVEDDSVREQLRQYISFGENQQSMARIKADAAKYNKQLNEQVEKDKAMLADNIESWVNINIEGEQEKAIAMDILSGYMDPKEGIKVLRQEYQNMLDSELQGVVDTMNAGMKQGVGLFMTDDDGNIIPNGQGVDVHIGGATRISNNDAWYSNYYKENKKAPSQKEVKRLAREALLGNNPYGIPTGLESLKGFEREQAEAEVRQRIEGTESVLASIDKVAPVLENMDTSELDLQLGLSEEAMRVFKTVKEYVMASPSKKSRITATADAVLVARAAEMYAKKKRAQGYINYTAMDYLKKLQLGDNVNVAGVSYNQQRSVYNYTYEENQWAIKDYVNGLTSLDNEPYIDLNDTYLEYNRYSSKEINGKLNEQYKTYLDSEMISPLGDKVKFDNDSIVKRYGSVENYLKRFIVNEKGEKTVSRAVGFMMVKETVENPYAIIVRPSKEVPKKGITIPERKVYIGIYRQGTLATTSVIVEIEETDKGKFITCDVAQDRGNGKNKNSALKDLKSQIKNAKEVLYYKGSLSKHLRKPTVQRTSTADASLHPSGKFILPQNYDVVNKKRNNYNDRVKVLINNLKVYNEILRTKEYFENEDVSDFYLKAPNGNESEYDAVQWMLINTEVFKKYYGLWDVEYQKKKFDIEQNNAIKVNSADYVFENLNNRAAQAKKLIAPVLGEVKTREGIFNIAEDFADTSFAHGREELKPGDKDLRLAALSTLSEGLKHMIYLGEMEDFYHKLKDGKGQESNSYDRYYSYWISTEDGKALVYLRLRDQRTKAERNNPTKESSKKVKLYLHDVFTEDEVNNMRNMSYKDANKVVEERVKSGNAGNDFGFYVISKFLNTPTNMKVDLLPNGEPDLSKIDNVSGTIELYNQAAGRNAETANIPMLEKAMELYNNTGDKNRVYEETGWYMGMDGKWRFEIPDNLNKINVNAFPGRNEEVSLWQIYDNPVLYAAYPWLADVKVYGAELEERTNGQADGESITLNVNRLFPKGRREFITTFNGERYYWSKPGITVEDKNRKEMPGEYNIAFKFIDQTKASGDSYQSVLDRLDKMLQDIDNNLAVAKEKNNIFAINNWEHAKELYGKAKALIESTHGEFESFDYYMEEDLDKKRLDVGKTLIHEIQHLIQREEEFAMGGNEKQVQQQIGRQMDKTKRALKTINVHGWDFYLAFEEYMDSYLSGDIDFVNKAKEKYDWFKSQYGITDEQEKKILKLGSEYRRLSDQWSSKDSNFDKYQNLHGEQEARLASQKAELTTQMEVMRESYEKGFDGIYEEWEKTAPEELKEKGKRLVQLRKDMNSEDENFEWTDELDEEHDSLVEIDELKDLEDELQQHELVRFRYEGLQQDYNELVTKGINEYKAIVVFGGEVVTGSALRQNNADVQGYSKRISETGQRIVELLESADQSTFMHEMAHIFYWDLEELALDENATEQDKKDWNAVRNWTGWQDGQLEEFKGTASYSDFAALDAAIREAQDTGYGMYDGKKHSLQSLLTRWEQERFARGFEEYLHSGKAPTKPLEGVFSKFKKWLGNIYRAIVGAGAKPSKEVKEVMDRIIATQEEIDNAIERANIEALKKQGLFEYLNGTSQEIWQRNLEKIKTDVASKVHKIAFRDLTEEAKEKREEQIKAERKAAHERISQEPVFVVQRFLEQNPQLSVSDAVNTLTDMTLEEYAEALKARGGNLNAAVDQYMETYEKMLKEPSKEEIRAAADEAVTNSYYTKLATAFEIEAMEQYVRDEQRLAKKLAGIKTKDAEERKKEEKAIRELDRKQRLQEERDRNVRALQQEQKANEKLNKELKELEAKILDYKSQLHAIQANIKRDKDARLAEVKDQMQNRIFEQIEKLTAKEKQLKEERRKRIDFQNTEGRGRRIYRDSLNNYVANIRKYAERKMSAMAISEATNPAMWKKMAENYADTSLELFARGEYELAARQKRISFFYQQMAELAEKNKAKVESKINTLTKHSQTMQKNNNITANERFLYNHLMYVFAMAQKDALKPPSYRGFKRVLVNYNENLELSYVDQDGNLDLPEWLMGAMASESDRYREGYKSLRVDQLETLYNVMQNIYKAGTDAKKLKNTHDVHGNVKTVDEVVSEITMEAFAVRDRENLDPTGMNGETRWEAVKDTANKAYVELLKPETILRQLGDKAMEYIYNPVKLAADNELQETEVLAGKIRGITEAYRDGLVEMYRNKGEANPEKKADQDMKDLRSKRQYRIGSSVITKEQLLALAFNWGTELNRQRVIDGFNVDEASVNKLLSELNSADWQMVINVWELFDDYWPRLQQVEANCSGVVLEKQQAFPFSVVDKDGVVYNLKGGYYPIKYDPKKDTQQNDYVGDEAKRVQLSSQSRLGMGLGNIKERKEFVNKKIRLDFGVMQESLADTIHNICMREAVRDVNRIIRDNSFHELMIAKYGQATTKMLEQWILDCWKKEPRQLDATNSAARWLRERQTVATLGFRTSTALLNFCNISYLFDYLGFARTMNALHKFYAHPSEQYGFALEKSVFLRERAETMDRDMGSVLKRNREKFGDSARSWLEEKAFWAISHTDLMLACPLWVSEYQRAFQEAMEKKLNPEQAEREAVLAGDAAVRRVFGSGQIQDQAQVQKGNEMTKIFTMYYSFFSVVHNALMMKIFESRQAWKDSMKSRAIEKHDANGNLLSSTPEYYRDYKEAAKALVPIAEGVIFWMIIPAAMEAGIRSMYGDKKDREAKNLAKKTLSTVAGTAVGGIPLARDMVPALIEKAMGGRYYGVSGTPIGDTADQIERVLSAAQSKKKTKLDVLREASRATAPLLRLPTTMTDAMVSTLQFIDHGKLTSEEIWRYFVAILFDKNPDKKK